MDDRDVGGRSEMSHSRRKLLYAVGGVGIVSAAGASELPAECHQD
jgi:hypothetical protein